MVLEGNIISLSSLTSPILNQEALALILTPVLIFDFVINPSNYHHRLWAQGSFVANLCLEVVMVNTPAGMVPVGDGKIMEEKGKGEDHEGDQKKFPAGRG